MRNFGFIGSGSGLEVSAEASDAGWPVAVVEEGPSGGTCLTRGCIPSKMPNHCAGVMPAIQNAASFGIHANAEWVNWPFIFHRPLQEVDVAAETIERSNQHNPDIEVFNGLRPTPFVTGLHPNICNRQNGTGDKES